MIYTEQLLVADDNQGLQFHHILSQDMFSPGNRPFDQEKEYYFGVAVYSVSADPTAIPRALERYPESIRIRVSPLPLLQKLNRMYSP